MHIHINGEITITTTTKHFWASIFQLLPSALMVGSVKQNCADEEISNYPICLQGWSGCSLGGIDRLLSNRCLLAN